MRWAIVVVILLLFCCSTVFGQEASQVKKYLVIYHYPNTEIQITRNELGELSATPIYTIQYQEMDESTMKSFLGGQYVDNRQEYQVLDVYKVSGKIVVGDHVTKTDKFIQVKVTDTEVHNYTYGGLWEK